MTYKKTVMAEPALILKEKKEIVGVCTAYQEPGLGWGKHIHRIISGECPEGSHIITISELQKRSQIERNLSSGIKEDTLHGIAWDFVEIELPIPAGWVRLEEKKWLNKWYGKYMPNLLFINHTPEHIWFFTESWEYNLGRISDLRVIRGKYFKTAKGADAFEASNQGPHILLGDNWGGAFNNYRGQNSPDPKDCLYQRVASSNGGGAGTTYSIVPFGYKASYDINEF